MSPSSRRAWIEIVWSCPTCRRATVALLAEGVDRNRSATPFRSISRVALLAEGVDRNSLERRTAYIRWRSPSSRRAWIEISHGNKLGFVAWSPSSRRAWIEIYGNGLFTACPIVALLAEGVDRNIGAARGAGLLLVALLAEGVDRNMETVGVFIVVGVALLAEGVDRNSILQAPRAARFCRPPRGGRG